MHLWLDFRKNAPGKLPPHTRYPWDEGLITISSVNKSGRKIEKLLIVEGQGVRGVINNEYHITVFWPVADYATVVGDENVIEKVLDYLWMCQLRNIKTKPASLISLQKAAGRKALMVRDEYGVPVISPQDLQELGIHPVKELAQITKDEYIASRAPGANPFDYYHEGFNQRGFTPFPSSMWPFDFGKKRRRSRRKRTSKGKR